MASMLWLLMSWTTAQAQAPEALAPCLDPAIVVGQAKSALIDARLEEVAERVADVEAALGCAPLVAPELLSELWMIEGVRLYFAQDPAGASRAFAASSRLHPLPWTPEYGLELKAFYDEAVAAPRGEAQLSLYEVPPGVSAALDGEPTAFPAAVIEGPHLVQILSEDDEVVAAHMVMLPPNEAMEIRVGPIAPRPVAPPSTTQRRPVLLVGGSVAALAAGGTYALARVQDNTMSSATATSSLEGAYQRQKLLAGTTYGLMGLSAVGFGLYFVM